MQPKEIVTQRQSEKRKLELKQVNMYIVDLNDLFMIGIVNQYMYYILEALGKYGHTHHILLFDHPGKIYWIPFPTKNSKTGFNRENINLGYRTTCQKRVVNK